MANVSQIPVWQALTLRSNYDGKTIQETDLRSFHRLIVVIYNHIGFTALLPDTFKVTAHYLLLYDSLSDQHQGQQTSTSERTLYEIA